jgi:hypothetical protein
MADDGRETGHIFPFLDHHACPKVGNPEYARNSGRQAVLMPVAESQVADPGSGEPKFVWGESGGDPPVAHHFEREPVS